MKWASAISNATASKRPVTALIGECCQQIREQLEEETPDLVIAFVSPYFIDDYDQVMSIIRHDLKAKNFIGCSASGLIGAGQEIEQKPAVSLVAAVLPGVDVKTFHLVNPDIPDADASPDKWYEIVGVPAEPRPHFILLPDPFSFNISTFIEGLDYAYPGTAKIGGLASGARRAGQSALWIQDKLYRNGMVGVALSGDILVETIVAQGCRPIGHALRVTKCDGNIIFEIDGTTAVNALHGVIQELTENEQALVSQSLYLGIAMSEFSSSHKAGDFLIRNIVGIEPNIGALVVGEPMREEQTIQFHVRDAASSADDLRMLLKQYRDEHNNEARGALLFSCLGRGEQLYGMGNHDSECFKQYLGEVPLAGFFCNGEIGPIGGTTFLHGYTSSFGIFRAQQQP